jgi:hypothetical protein
VALKRDEMGLNRHCEPPDRANARPMTGSAKQSITSNEEWIASSLSLLAMTAWSVIEPDLILLEPLFHVKQALRIKK